MTAAASMRLHTASIGQRVLLQAIHDAETELLLLRFGVGVGDTLQVVAKPPGGPLVLDKNGLEVALGRSYAAFIEITLL